MSVIDALIFDRTEEDVARLYALKAKVMTGGINALSAGELTEYMGGMKGAYNFTDLNRVGEAIQYIADELTGFGYHITVAPKTDWTVNDVPSRAQMLTYLADVQALRDKIAVYSDTPEVPGNMDGLTYALANDIEKILADIGDIIDKLGSNVDLGWVLGTAHLGLWGGI